MAEGDKRVNVRPGNAGKILMYLFFLNFFTTAIGITCSLACQRDNLAILAFIGGLVVHIVLGLLMEFLDGRDKRSHKTQPSDRETSDEIPYTCPGGSNEENFILSLFAFAVIVVVLSCCVGAPVAWIVRLLFHL